MSVTAEGTDLATFGLRLVRVDGHLDLPRYKEILAESELPEELRVLEEKEILVRMYGEWANKTSLGTTVLAFQNFLKTKTVMWWQFSAHAITGFFVLKDGMKVNIYKNVAELVFVLRETTEGV